LVSGFDIRRGTVVFEQFMHWAIDVVDRNVPAALKRQIKRANPQLVEGFYRQVTRRTSDRVVNVQIQGGRLSGRRFFCSLRHQRSCFLGNFEPQKEAILVQYLGPGKVFFDVGGHIGYFSLIAATLVRPNGAVAAFEPSPTNASQFQQNLSVNPDLASLIRLQVAAASDAVGRAVFERGENSYVGHLVEGASQSGFDVPTTTLDAFATAQNLWPDLLKIDAEGAEPMIFRGMTQILERSRPVLLVEIHDVAGYEALLALLHRYGYAGRRVDGVPTFSDRPEYVAEAEYIAIPQ
jgi:FkbM family methyltransferase